MSTETLNPQDWVGRSEAVDDVITATPCAALAATLDRPAQRPASGTPLHAGDILVGELLSVHGAVGLAMLQVEAVEKALALSQDIRCHQQRVKIRSPEWLTFS